MQRSSETIGTIAAALAKAQAQLVNPEKSLVGTIRSDPSGSERSFRYAPLSTGLDIVRKTLSQHKIATVQTTSIDEGSGIVRLSTVLAHASGEWIASDWPVCAISETSVPHRMGAALTYARRYALFTLVGIAGDDDLDAPDLQSPAAPDTQVSAATSNEKDRLNGGQRKPGQRSLGGHRTRAATITTRVALEPDASAALRDQLTGELSTIRSSEEAAKWAHRVLGAKNTLTAVDAARVEQAFRDRLLVLTVPTRTPAAQDPEQPVRGNAAKSDAGPMLIKARSRCRHRGGFATGTTSDRLPNNPAWSVGAVLPMPITCDLRSH